MYNDLLNFNNETKHCLSPYFVNDQSSAASAAQNAAKRPLWAFLGFRHIFHFIWPLPGNSFQEIAAFSAMSFFGLRLL